MDFRYVSRAAACLLLLSLAACGGLADKVENVANRTYTSAAMGKSYTAITATDNSAIAALSGRRSNFGPTIGSTPLQNGDIVYRHIQPASKSSSDTSILGLVGTAAVKTNYRLSYFLVGQDGLVRDWATGAVPGTTSDCITFLSGIVQRCQDSQRLQASLQHYDSRVQTRSGQPIAVWGAPAEVPSPAAPR